MAVVEFKSGESVQFLQDTLPCSQPSKKPGVLITFNFYLKYMLLKSSDFIHSYLAKLKSVAKLNGADFEKIMLDEEEESIRSDSTSSVLSKVRQNNQPTPDIPQTQLSGNEVYIPTRRNTDPTVHDPDFNPSTVGAATPLLPRKQILPWSPELITTYEVQKVVFEHVIMKSDATSLFH